MGKVVAWRKFILISRALQVEGLKSDPLRSRAGAGWRSLHLIIRQLGSTPRHLTEFAEVLKGQEEKEKKTTRSTEAHGEIKPHINKLIYLTGHR